jgi:hypothetical protein
MTRHSALAEVVIIPAAFAFTEQYRKALRHVDP